MAEATSYRGSIRVGSHAYASAFLDAGFEVMWMGAPLYPHSFFRHDHDTIRRVAIWKRRGAVCGDGALEYYPLAMLPPVDRALLRSGFVARNAIRFSFPSAEHVLHDRGYARPDLLWLSQSRLGASLARRIRGVRTAYRISDDWSKFRGIPHSLIDAERRVVQRADAVFATSRTLVDMYGDINPRITYLPNGVAGAFFEERAEPRWFATYPRPRVVYVGSLSWWLDREIIEATARACPGATVILVGPGEAPARLPENVVAPGPAEWEDVPGILQHSDVGIIPFSRNELTHAVSPVKLYEYLASGLPVVATRLDEIEAAGSPARLCDSPDDFAASVASILSGSAPNRDAARSFARDHTWTNRFRIVREVLSL